MKRISVGVFKILTEHTSGSVNAGWRFSAYNYRNYI